MTDDDGVFRRFRDIRLDLETRAGDPVQVENEFVNGVLFRDGRPGRLDDDDLGLAPFGELHSGRN